MLFCIPSVDDDRIDDDDDDRGRNHKSNNQDSLFAYCSIPVRNSHILNLDSPANKQNDR